MSTLNKYVRDSVSDGLLHLMKETIYLTMNFLTEDVSDLGNI
jgi:hypothetical protein